MSLKLSTENIYVYWFYSCQSEASLTRNKSFQEGNSGRCGCAMFFKAILKTRQIFLKNAAHKLTNYLGILSIRKILVSVKFVSAILGPEMGAPILWTPGKMRSFCRKKPMSIKFLVVGGGCFGFFGGGGECQFYFYGRADFSDSIRCHNPGPFRGDRISHFKPPWVGLKINESRMSHIRWFSPLLLSPGRALDFVA